MVQQHKATSLATYLEIVNKIHTEWDIAPWFRGQPNAGFGLEPSSSRHKRVRESDLRGGFKDSAIAFIRDLVPRDEWEWYFLMRHHGIPTRLLDWTDSSLFGLYFALRYIQFEKDRKAKADASVWVLDPWRLNKIAVGVERILYGDSPEVENYLPPTTKGTLIIPEYPVAVQPSSISPRIVAQRGKFTVHGKRREGIEVLMEDEKDKEPRLAKITIPASDIPSIMADLDVAGVRESTVFPDLDGLARELTTRFVTD